MNFFKIKFNRRLFSVALLIVLVFGGSSFCYKSSAYEGQNFNGHILKKGENISPFNVGVDEFGASAIVKDAKGDIVKVIDSKNKDSTTSPSVWLVKISSDFLMWTVSEKLYTEVFFSKTAKEGVTQAWKTVRGFVNMFYLLILVFLAITTILQINSFNDKKLFFNVIVSAILVNFSMAITLVVIDFSNLIMVYFASAIQHINPGSFFLDKTEYAKNMLVNADSSIFLSAASSMFGFIINVVIAVMLLFTAISLLIRLIAYWVLIILSPLAFFSIAIPGSNGFNEWKDKLIHYSFYGPIMLFFIWLAMSLSAYLNKAFAQAESIDGWSGFVKFLTSYITVLYLLYYGHDKSKAMAAKAGDFAGKIMDKGGQYAVKAGKMTGMAVSGGYIADRYIGESARAHWSGAKALMHKKGLGEEAKKERQAKKDLRAKVKWTGGDVNKHDQRAELAELQKTEKEMKENGYDLTNVSELKKTLNEGGKEGKIAAMKLAEMGRLDVHELESAIELSGNNDILKDSIYGNMKKKNTATYTKLAAKKYGERGYKKMTEEIDKNIKKYEDNMMLPSGSINTASVGTADRMEYALQGMMTEMSASDKAELLNQDTSVAGSVEVGNIMENYHNVSWNKLSDREKISLQERIKSNAAKAVLTNTLAP